MNFWWSIGWLTTTFGGINMEGMYPFDPVGPLLRHPPIEIKRLVGKDTVCKGEYSRLAL